MSCVDEEGAEVTSVAPNAETEVRRVCGNMHLRLEIVHLGLQCQTRGEHLALCSQNPPGASEPDAPFGYSGLQPVRPKFGRVTGRIYGAMPGFAQSESRHSAKIWP